MTTLEAPHGEKTTEISIRLHTDKIADEPNHIVPKHAWDSGSSGEPLDGKLDDTRSALASEGSRRVDFMGLNARTCRWPLFEGHEPFHEKFYCGAQKVVGSPYCTEHAGQAFTRRTFGRAEAANTPAPQAQQSEVLSRCHPVSPATPAAERY